MAQPIDYYLLCHRDPKLLGCKIVLPGKGVNEHLHVGLDRLGQVEGRLRAQELQQTRNIVAVLLYVLFIDLLALPTAAAEIDPGTRLEGDQAGFV